MKIPAFGKRLASRKGAAIEMAILVMVITTSMSIMILTTAMLQHSRQLQVKEEMGHSVVLEQIGDDFCAAVGQPEQTWVARYPDYEIAINGLEMSVKKAGSETTLLRVSLEKNGNTYRILRWDLQ